MEKVTGDVVYLYGLTLAIEFVGASARFFIFRLIGLFFVWVLSTLAGMLWYPLADLVNFVGEAIVFLVALFIACGPIVLSILTALGLTGGFLLTRWKLGARDASSREKTYIHRAIGEIASVAPKVQSADHYFVIDTFGESASIVGSTIYINRDMIESEYLPAVLAHELGHLENGDSYLVLALNRLVWIPTARVDMKGGNTDIFYGYALLVFNIFLSILLGGLGVYLTQPFWTWYWQDREYMADKFAAGLGYADKLIAFLEKHKTLYHSVPFYMVEHPPTELRIDRLMKSVPIQQVKETPATYSQQKLRY